MIRFLQIKCNLAGMEELMIRTGKWNRIVFAFMVSIAIVGGTGCGAEEQKAEVPKLVDPVGVDVDTAVVKKMNLSSVNSYQGEVIPDMKGVYFANSGQVGSVKVQIGDKVKKGQLLATLSGSETDVKELKADLANQLDENTESNESSKSRIAQMQLELKEIKKQRNKAKNRKEKGNLKKQQIAKEEEIKTEKLKFTLQKQTQNQYIKELKSDIQAAAEQAKMNKLYATVNGEVITKNLAPGDFVTGGVPVITIADMEKTKIFTQYIGSSVLDRASGYMATINGKQYEVTVEEQKISQLDIDMGNLPSGTYFNYEKDENVSVGDSVVLEFYNDATENALVIPSNAVYKAKNDRYVYRMEGDARKRVAITTGTVTDAYTQVLTGLKEGDVVYVQS